LPLVVHGGASWQHRQRLADVAAERGRHEQAGPAVTLGEAGGEQPRFEPARGRPLRTVVGEQVVDADALSRR